MSVSIVGNSAFSITSQPTSPIAPNGSSTFTLQFEPTQPGTFNAEVMITSSDSASFEFEVQGTANNPAIAVNWVIDNSSPVGFSTTGTWTRTARASMAANSTLAGTGNAQANYSFTGLPGQYQILASWSPLTAGRATPRSRSTTAARRWRFDRKSVVGAERCSNDGLASHRPGECHDSTLQVAITNDANPGGSVIADAIEIGQLPGVSVSYGELAVSDFMTGIAPNATPATANGTDFGSAAVSFNGTVHTFTLTNNGLATLNFTGSNPVLLRARPLVLLASRV